MRFSLINSFKLALCGATALVLVACTSAEERAKNYTDSGNKYLEKQDYDRAAIEFRNALKLKDDSADAWFGMAQVEEHQKNWQHLMGDLNKVIEIDPAYVKAHQALASFLMFSRNYPQALKAANQAIALEPKNQDLILLRAAILLNSGDPAGARVEANRVLAVEPDSPDAAVLLGRLNLDAGKTAEALAIANKGLAKNPKSLGLRLLKIRLLEMTRDVPGQEAELRTLIMQDPGNKAYKKVLVGFLVQNNQTDAAEAELRAIQSANPDDLEILDQLNAFLMQFRGPDTARAGLVNLVAANPASFIYGRRLAQMDFEAGNTDAAIARLSALASSTPKPEDQQSARTDLATNYMALGKMAEARALTDQVLATEPDNIAGLKARAVLLREEGAYDEAISVLRTAVNLDSKDSDLRLILANTYERKGSFELANVEFNAAWEKRDDPRIGMDFARYMVRRGDAARADDLLSELAAAQPARMDVLHLLAQVQLQRSNFSGAIDTANKIEALTKSSAEANSIRASVLSGSGRTAEALAMLVKNASAAPDDPVAITSLVQAYLQTRHFAEAENFVHGILARRPDDALALASLGAVQLEQGKLADAEKNFRLALAKKPDLPIATLALADFYARQNRYDEAIATLETGLEKLKDNPDIRMMLASLYLTTDKSAEALKQYESILALGVDMPLAANNFAGIIADNSDNIDELKRAAKVAAVLRDSPFPQFRETYGWLLVRTGQVKSGLQILERTIDELHDMAIAQYHLGAAYLANGDIRLAEEHLKSALLLEKNVTQRLKIEAALRQAQQAGQK